MNTITATLAEALRLGKEGAPPTEAERLLFEEWMRGHCWKVCGTWNGRQYVHESESRGDVYPPAVNTRQLFAAWRDRAALATFEAQADAKPAPAEPVAQAVWETLEQRIQNRYRVEPLGNVFWPYVVRSGDGTRAIYVDHKSKCDEVAAALTTACLDGAFMLSHANHCAAPAAPARCPYCDDTGDVHSPTGEWRGECKCGATT